MKKRLLLLGTCFTLFLTSCSSPARNIANTVKNVTNNVQATSTPEPTGTPAPTETNLKLGETGTVGNWKICMKKAEVKSKIKSGKYRIFEPDKGKKFISITTTIQNTGKEKEAFLPRVGYKGKMLIATLYTQDKEEYQPLELLAYDRDLVNEQIKPLTNTTGIIVFHVPKKVAKKKGKLTVNIGTGTENLIYSLK